MQYVSDADGKPVSVIIPIDLWHEIASERETAYLLRSETMKKRLLEAKERTTGISLEYARARLEFDSTTYSCLFCLTPLGSLRLSACFLRA